jgi:hypothetical protein
VSLQAIEGALGEHAPLYYVPRAQLFVNDDRTGLGADEVASDVLALFRNAAEIEMVAVDDIVSVRAHAQGRALRAEFHVRFGLIGSVSVTVVAVAD